MTEFYCPTKIISGPRALEHLRTYTAKRVLVVTDRYFSQSGKALEIGNMVPEAEVRIFDAVTPDPQASLAASGAAECRSFEPDLLLALGGGSPMDCAKAIRMISERPMSFVAIPTTSGSGSEVTSFSVLTHNGVKHPLVDPILRPDVAILDDSLLTQLPKTLIADAGMDVLAHCLEAVAAKNRSTISDALAFHAVGIILRDLPKSYDGDLSVRGRIHEAASMAGMAFDQAGLGLCHAMAHALGELTHISHGRLCAMLLPHVLRLHTGATAEQYAALAQNCGLGAATEKLCVQNLIRAVVRLRKALQMPQTLYEAGVTVSDTAGITAAVLADPCCRTNPMPVSAEQVQQIWKAVQL